MVSVSQRELGTDDSASQHEPGKSYYLGSQENPHRCVFFLDIEFQRGCLEGKNQQQPVSTWYNFLILDQAF